jgi:hypothetical protein
MVVKSRAIAFLALLLATVAVALAAAPLPEKIVTLADVQAVLGGKFEGRLVEPGIYKYEENDGPRVVQVSIQTDSGTTVQDLKPHLIQQGEPVDDVAGVGDAAMYRPQGFCAAVDKTSKSGQSHFLEVWVHNVEGANAAADTKRLAIELAKRGAARL